MGSTLCHKITVSTFGVLQDFYDWLSNSINKQYINKYKLELNRPNMFL